MRQTFIKLIVIPALIIVQVVSCGVLSWFRIEGDTSLGWRIFIAIFALAGGLGITWVILERGDYDFLLIGKGIVFGGILAVFMAVVSRLNPTASPQSPAVSGAFALMAGPFVVINPIAAGLGAIFGALVGLVILLVLLIGGSLESFGESLSVWIYFILFFTIIVPMLWAKHNKTRF